MDRGEAVRHLRYTKFGGLIDDERGGCYLVSGKKTTDVPCPNDGELANVCCWQCGWKRDAAEREQTIEKHHYAEKGNP